MGEAVRLADDDDRRQGPGLGQEQVVHRHHHLLSLKAELHGDLFHGIDGGPVHIGLASLAEAAIAHGDAEALEEAFERRRPAIHGGGLDDLGHDEAAAPGRVRGHRSALTYRSWKLVRGSGRGEQEPSGAQYQRGRRDVINLDLNGPRQAVLKGNRRGSIRIDGQLDPDPSIADLAGDAGDRRRNGPVLRPGEALEAQPCRLAGLDPPQRRRWEEVGYDFERPRRDDSAQLIPFADHCTDLHDGQLHRVARPQATGSSAW